MYTIRITLNSKELKCGGKGTDLQAILSRFTVNLSPNLD